MKNIQSGYRQNQYDKAEKKPPALLPEVVGRNYKVGVEVNHSKKNGAKPVEYSPD
jgi:hypothetical protein